MVDDYETCKCGHKPGIHKDKFNIIYHQFGGFPDLQKPPSYWEATCKTCGEVFTCE